MTMLYRSPLTRCFLSAVGLTTGVILLCGNGHKWRNTASLQWLNTAVPLRLLGAAFITYALLLLLERTRAGAYSTGFVLFGACTVSLIVTLHPGSPDPKNIIAVAAMLDATAFHAYSVRTAWTARVFSGRDRRRR